MIIERPGVRNRLCRPMQMDNRIGSIESLRIICAVLTLHANVRCAARHRAAHLPGGDDTDAAS